jgi:hypothetical protein
MQISELGNLYDGYSYYPGLVKLYTDAKGNGTSYTYQAFDEPTEDAITQINVSAGVSVNIARDIFGKTTSITRSGSGVSATRSYVYDGYERLCKTIEPETGATIQDYDAANNVAWRATGLGLTATNACNTGDVPGSKQIAYTYDARNRLRNTTYGDGSPAIYRTYTNDGLPNTTQSDGTLWTYGYNNRRLPTSETLNYGGVNYSIGRSYDANGSLSQLTYPDNFSVAYNPNALAKRARPAATPRACTTTPTAQSSSSATAMASRIRSSSTCAACRNCRKTVPCSRTCTPTITTPTSPRSPTRPKASRPAAWSTTASTA